MTSEEIKEMNENVSNLMAELAPILNKYQAQIVMTTLSRMLMGGAIAAKIPRKRLFEAISSSWKLMNISIKEAMHDE